MTVRILLLTQYYPPEMGAAAGLMADIAATAAARGHEVDVVTAMPNYPTGVIAEPYRGRVYARERDGGVVVHRVWLAASPVASNPRRLLRYLSFATTALVAGLATRPAPDVVVANSPPLFVALAGTALARLRRIRLVLNIEDLWPRAAIEIGVLQPGLLLRLATAAEEGMYRQAALVAGQTEGIVRSIRSRTASRTTVLFAGADISLFAPDAGDLDVARSLGIGERTAVGYAGLHGLWQSLDTVVDAAALLRSRSDLEFVLIGDGPTKTDIARRVARQRLENVRLLPPQPLATIAALAPLWRAGIVPLISVPLTAAALPAKLFELMAAGVPVLYSGPFGEAAELIADARCGIVAKPGDAEELASAVLDVLDDPRRAAALGENGRAAAVERFDRRKIIGGLVDEIVRLGTAEVSAPWGLKSGRWRQHEDDGERGAQVG